MARSLATTVATPAKWVGRATPSRPALMPRDRHRRQGRGPEGVHLLDARVQHVVDAGGAEQVEVVLEVAWVGGKILAGRELQRVDEDRGDDELVATIGSRRVGEGAVPVVEVAHRRHEPHRSAGRREGGPERRDRVVQLRRGGAHTVEPARRPHPPRSGGSRWRRLPPAAVGSAEEPAAELDAGPVRSRSSSGRSSRWRSTVAQSPRRTGPVRAAAGPTAATLATAPAARSRYASSGTPTVAATRSTCPRSPTRWLAAIAAAAW